MFIFVEPASCSACGANNSEHVETSSQSFTRCRSCGHIGNVQNNRTAQTTDAGFVAKYVATEQKKRTF